MSRRLEPDDTGERPPEPKEAKREKNTSLLTDRSRASIAEEKRKQPVDEVFGTSKPYAEWIETLALHLAHTPAFLVWARNPGPYANVAIKHDWLADVFLRGRFTLHEDYQFAVCLAFNRQCRHLLSLDSLSSAGGTSVTGSVSWSVPTKLLALSFQTSKRASKTRMRNPGWFDRSARDS